MRAVLPLLLAGCYQGFDTEEAQLRLMPDESVVTEPFLGLFPANSPLLQGSELCATVSCGADASCPSELLVGDCYEQTVEGGVLLNRDCVSAPDVGTLVWHFDPIDDLTKCGADPAAYAPLPDRATLTVVPAEEITAAWEQWAEAAAAESLEPVGVAFPDDWTVAEGEPFHVVAGGTLLLPVVLRHPKWAGAVAYDADLVQISVVTTGGTAPVVTVPHPGWVRIAPSAGSEGEVRVAVGGQEWVAGRFVGVAPAIASIEVVPAYVASEGERLPFGARAVVRDAAGTLLYGAPIAWTVTAGALAIEPGATDLPGPDYAMLRDACLRPPKDAPETRRVTFEARVGEIADAADLSWLVTVPEAPADDFRADAFCQDADAGLIGCGCDSGRAGGAPLLALALLAARRRQRATSASGNRPGSAPGPTPRSAASSATVA